MPILARPDLGYFFQPNGSLMYERWPVCPEVHGAWRVALTVGTDALRAVFGDSIFRRPCDSYWIADDFGNLVRVQ